MGSIKRPVVLLLGAKSSTRPLAAIPGELSQLEALFAGYKHAEPSFELETSPYFTQDQLNSKLDRLADRVALLHFAGHSDAEGLLTDDETVYSRHIAAHIRSWSQPPSLIFLNGCHNAAQVQDFHAAGVAVVIATHKPISDTQAAAFARGFYTSLLTAPAQTSLQAAFERAGATVLMGKNRQTRSIDLQSLDSEDMSTLDWSPYPQHDEQLEWTLRELITHDRPVLDAQGALLNPYKGLEAFQERDEIWFFGREVLTDELVQKIPVTPFYTLMGASGSGKSSLINAGVVPQLRERDTSLILQCRPALAPFAELSQVLTRILYPDALEQAAKQKELPARLQEQHISITDLIPGLLRTRGKTHLYLFIDQFEELFTQSTPKVIQSFLTQLVALVQSENACTLILMMRADFLAAALVYPDFAQLIDSHPHKLLSPMSKAELRVAIERPAARQHVSLEPALIEALLDAVENQAGSLPLLQYVLSLLWEKRQERTIQLDNYNAFGGLEKALESRANEIYQGFTPAQQTYCQRIFLRLVRLGDGTEDTRKRADLDDFAHDDEQVIIKVLADARLITTQRHPGDKKAYAEVSHEALIRHWPLLQEWIRENRDELRVQNQVTAATKEWEIHSRGKDWLLTGTRLGVAEEWLGKNPKQATVDEIAFIRAGINEYNRVLQEKETQRQRELQLEEDKRRLAEQRAEEQRRALQKTQRLSRIMGVITLVMVVVAGVAWYFFETAKREEQNALKARAETEEVNTELAGKNKLANYRLAKVFEEKAENYIDSRFFVEVLAGKKNDDPLALKKRFLYMLDAAAQDIPAGKVAVKARVLGNLSLLSEQDIPTERKQLPHLKSGSIQAVAYSPDGKVIASGSWDNTIRLWDASGGESLKTLQGHDGPVRALAYSPDGKVMVSGSEDKTILLWDVYSGENIQTLQGHNDPVRTLAYSPDGEVIASGSDDHTIRLWDAQTGENFKTLKGHTGFVSALAYSPNGKVIASGSYDHTVRLWGVQTGEVLKTLKGHAGFVNALVYSPDGKVVVSGANDDAVKIWDVQSGETLQTLQGHTDSVYALAYSPDREVIASGSGDDTVRLWDVRGKETLHTLRGHNRVVIALSYSPDGKVVVSGSDDGAVRYWGVQTGEALKILQGQNSLVYALAYSPDGKVMASGSDDSTVSIWDGDNGELLRNLQGHTGSVYALAYSPDSQMLASGSEDGMIRLWDVKSGESLRTLQGHTGSVSTLAYSPDGKVIASGSSDNSIRLWDVSTGEALQTLQGHTGWLNIVAYSPDGQVIASASRDKTVRLWDARSGETLHMLRHTKPVYALAYHPDGEVVALGLSDNTIRLWDTGSGKILKTLKGDNEAIMALAYSPDGKVIVSGVSDKTVRLWDLTTPNHQLVYDFDPDQVSDALKFLWQLELDELEYVHKAYPPSLFPQMGYNIRFTKETCPYRELLDMPRPGETKLRQVVRYLRDRCAYKYPRHDYDCKPLPLTYDCSAYE